MSNNYKIVISNKNLYREIELPNGVDKYSIGTYIECDFRLHKNLFFDDFKMEFIDEKGQWRIVCSDNIFISTGDTRRMLTIKLNYGDNIVIKYQETNSDVFNIEFTLDFDVKNRNFERKILINNINFFSIGYKNENSIIIKSQYINKDRVNFKKVLDKFQIELIDITYGVYINGNKAKNGDILKSGDFISISDFMFYYKDDCLWTQISEDCCVKNLSYIDYPITNNYPLFVRNTRIKQKLDEEKIQILDPPKKPEKPKTNILMSLLPTMGLLLAAGIMGFIGGGMIILSIVSGVMAVITTIVGLIQNNKEYKKSIEERIVKYNAYISNKINEIENYRNTEREILDKIYTNNQNNKIKIKQFSSDLFDRRKEDDDFLHIRLGTGTVLSKKQIDYKKQEKLEIEDDLQTMPEKLWIKYKMIDNCAVVCELSKINALGIVGKNIYRYELFKIIVLDIISRHFYNDVKLFFIASKDDGNILHNFRLLPHLDKTINIIRNIAIDEESKKIIFENLYNILTARKEQKIYDQHLIIMLYNQCEFGSHPISKFIDDAKELGVTFIFFEDKKELIPMGCEKIISISNDQYAELIDTNNSHSTVFSYDKILDEEITNIVQIMAGIKTEEISLEGNLTKNINLFELLKILEVNDLDLSKRWGKTKVYETMSVPLGVSKTGVVYLDLHDKFHGPHGLVAGTTGSGKSEILQTYILSIATLFHPYEVSFLIIDFKGGGMVNQFKDLPHLLGAITNIDGKEIDRSLKSIKAELQKRQMLFAQAEVNHIDKYIKKFKSGKIDTPLPHLIIIVDEFAELKAEQPEFMKELISAARIGRSLGVHLILATQKPAGQVDDQIWSNSRFKLCLKVQGPEDSNEVLKSPLAAEIKEPGRAYLQVGNNEIFELFQSAYSGASEKNQSDDVKPFKIYKLNTYGKRSLVFEQKKQKQSDAGKTQLEAIVDHVAQYCKKQMIKNLPSICLESLKHIIEFDESKFMNASNFDIGIYDDPDNQYQGNTYIDIDNKNTLIIGSSQYGKTNLLQLLIREIALKYTPKQANIYILDFGSMVLKNFEMLNHVGGVVCSSDDEKLKNLFKLLQEEVIFRKEKLLSVGVSSFTAYCQAGKEDLPKIYLFIDNITALMELYLENDESLLSLIREGLSVGISVIMTNSQMTGIGYKYISNFANKIALYCNDNNQYANLFDHISLKPDDIVGRCIIEIDKRILECQTYLSFNGEKEHERASEIKQFILKINNKYLNQKAKLIPFIPSILTKDIMENNFNEKIDKYKIPMGLYYNDVSTFYMDFSSLGAIGICGKEKKGHYNFIANVLTQFNDNRDKNPVEVVIFDDVSRKFNNLSNLDIVKQYTLNINEIYQVFNEWISILEDRYQAMIEERESKNNSLLVLVIQNNDIAKKIYEDMDLMNQYNDIIGRFKSLNICVIFSNYSNVNISYDSPEPLRKIKQEQHLLLFDDLDTLKVFDVPYEYLKMNKKRLQLGDAYYINEYEIDKIKLIKYEQ